MIVSKYTYFLKSSDNKYLIYNSQTNSFIEVYKDLFIGLRRFNKHYDIDALNIDEATKALLERHKILINDSECDDYFYKEKLISCASAFSQKELALTLVPTTGCNFDCPYCFESHKKTKIMSDAVIDDLITFMKNHEQAETLRITWYGGEPLMAFKVMKKIIHKIKSETTLKLTSHDIITNGYYFNQEVCDFFKDNPLNSMQITLDGNRESHDQKRKLKKTGKATFDKIIQNIGLILKELPNVQLSIRINIDKQNKDAYYETYSYLTQLFDKTKMYIYPGFIRIDDESKQELGCESLLSQDKSNLYFNLAEQGGIDVKFYPQLVKKGCGANCINYYIIGPSGEIYKCWNDVSDPDKIVGYINRKEITNSQLLSRYLVGATCFDDKQCKECFFFPICSGGCAWYRMKNFFEQGKYNLCTLYKDKATFDKCLEYFYHHRQKTNYQLNFS